LDIEGLTIVDDPNIQDGENGRSVEETAWARRDKFMPWYNYAR
jgi:hypothetical protein